MKEQLGSEAGCPEQKGRTQSPPRPHPQSPAGMGHVSSFPRVLEFGGHSRPSASPEDRVMLGGALTLSPCVSGGTEWGSASSFREAARPLARIDGKLQGSKPSFLCN